MLLNKEYYTTLWDKFQNIETRSAAFDDNSAILTFKIILDHCRRKKPIHINFQNLEAIPHQIARELFIELSNEIFCNAADFPQLNVGDKVRSKTAIRVGSPKPRFLDFKIVSVKNDKYVLRNDKFSFNWEKTFDELVEKFIPVTQRAQNETLTRFTSFFEVLNGKHVHDFTPTYFDRKSVFIAPKAFYDSLDVKNKIPTTYFPNPREESNPHETKSIPALPDSIMYFASKYKVCYEKIIQQGKKVDTLIIFDAEEIEIEQIVQDKNRYGFNLIVLTNNAKPIKCGQVPCWNWYREEIEIVNAL